MDYVDEMVVDGFFTTIHCSLKFLLENTETKADMSALFEAQMELMVRVIVLSLDGRIPGILVVFKLTNKPAA